ncbi:rho GTPase-activating protein gacO-like [Penaeus chinensis]|uniref:rho GTPase-activating protein gacO-like n=1 Tax=Penaeus chinensis TaxID=139456 RepID=UPI001FB5B0F9|nr:rho GTPase-activating protein gacO-like [Penaeus chinensis]
MPLVPEPKAKVTSRLTLAGSPQLVACVVAAVVLQAPPKPRFSASDQLLATTADTADPGHPAGGPLVDTLTPPTTPAPSRGLLRSAPPLLSSLPLLELPRPAHDSGTVCEGRVCEGKACGRPRGCSGDGGMKASSEEAAGPVLPVWQTLKGLSSRDVQCSGSPTSTAPGSAAPAAVTSPGASHPHRSLQASSLAAERLARLDTEPSEAPSPSSPFPPPRIEPPNFLMTPEGERSPSMANGSAGPPLSAPPVLPGNEAHKRAPWGPPSSSTTSTSLSNTNLTLHNNNNNNNNNNTVVSNNSINYAASPKEERPDEEASHVFREIGPFAPRSNYDDGAGI